MQKRRSPAPRQQRQEQQRKSRHRAPRARNSNQGGAVEASILRSLINGLSTDAELESKNCLPSLFPSRCCEREVRCSGAPKTWEFPSQKRREGPASKSSCFFSSRERAGGGRRGVVVEECLFVIRRPLHGDSTAVGPFAVRRQVSSAARESERAKLLKKPTLSALWAERKTRRKEKEGQW